MKKIVMRLAALITAIMMSVTTQAKAQDLGGTVVNENGEPIAFVNVVLLSRPDSAFVQGAVTDEQGHFNITTSKNEGILRLTCVGYETIFWM